MAEGTRSGPLSADEKVVARCNGAPNPPGSAGAGEWAREPAPSALEGPGSAGSRGGAGDFEGCRAGPLRTRSRHPAPDGGGKAFTEPVPDFRSGDLGSTLRPQLTGRFTVRGRRHRYGGLGVCRVGWGHACAGWPPGGTGFTYDREASSGRRGHEFRMVAERPRARCLAAVRAALGPGPGLRKEAEARSRRISRLAPLLAGRGRGGVRPAETGRGHRRVTRAAPCRHRFHTGPGQRSWEAVDQLARRRRLPASAMEKTLVLPVAGARLLPGPMLGRRRDRLTTPPV